MKHAGYLQIKVNIREMLDGDWKKRFYQVVEASGKTIGVMTLDEFEIVKRAV